MSSSRLRLGVNVDHVATIRNARGGRHPDPVRAAQASRSRRAPTASPPICARTAGTSATRTSRASRPRSQSRSIWKWRRPMRWFAIAVASRAARRLPRAGATRGAHHRRRARRRRAAGGNSRPPLPRSSGPASASRCSSPPSRAQIEAAAALGAPVIEIHTGAWCDALADGRTAAAQAEWLRIRDGARLARRLGPRSSCRPRARFRRPPRRSPRCPRSSSSTSAIS